MTNVAAAITLAATHGEASNAIFNVGEHHTPSMAERLARPPARAETPELPPFDFRQPLVLDTSAIRKRLGYADVVDEARSMREMAIIAGSAD